MMDRPDSVSRVMPPTTTMVPFWSGDDAGVLLAACAERAPTDPSTLEGPWQIELPFGADGVTMPAEPWSAGAWPDDLVSLTYLVEAPGSTLFLGARDGRGQVWTDPSRPELSPNRALRGRDLAVGAWPASSAALAMTPAFVGMAVAVEIPPGGAGAPVPLAVVSQAGSLGHLFKMALIVMVKRHPTEAGHEQIGPAVIVEISRYRRHGITTLNFSDA